MAQPELTLNWEGPYVMKDLVNTNFPGFYCISSYRNGKPSKLLYIGQSNSGSIMGRLRQHEDSWFSDYRSVKVHYCVLTREELGRLGKKGVLCVENALIYAYDPERNKGNRFMLRSDMAYNTYLIRNTGNLPKKFEPILDMEKLAEDYFRNGVRKKKVETKKRDSGWLI